MISPPLTITVHQSPRTAAEYSVCGSNSISINEDARRTARGSFLFKVIDLSKVTNHDKGSTPAASGF
eukprot:scaffold103414_cov18-Prasinocladus_malaysianus.AAC.1